MKVILRKAESGQARKDDVEVDINPDELIESVRKRIQDKHGIDCYKLIHSGKTLKDDKTLRFYSIMDGATLLIQGTYQNQYLPQGVTPSMEKRKADEAMLDENVVTLAPESKRLATEAAAENLMEANISWIGVQCATHGEKGMRRQMEDEHLICPSLQSQCPSLPDDRNFALFAILDGHGGKQVANFVKTYLAVELANALCAEEPKEAPLNDKRLKKTIEATCQRLDSRIATELPGAFDGCTAIILLVNAEMAICANLGDSMAYLSREKDGEAQAIPLQLRQHKCWMMKEKERILRAGGAVENGRINGVLEVSRAFGDITLKKFGVLCVPEYMKFAIDRSLDKFVLLACDGFWNAWTAAEALEYTTGMIETEVERAEQDEDEVDLRGCCRELVSHVVEEKKAQDNVSVLLVRIGQKK